MKPRAWTNLRRSVFAVPLFSFAASLGSIDSAIAAWTHWEISPSDRTMNLVVPGLGSWTPGTGRGQDIGTSGTSEYEIVTWNGFADSKPNARLILNTSSTGFTPSMVGIERTAARFINPFADKLNVQTSFFDEEIYDSESSIGPVEYLRFKVKSEAVEKNCVFFERTYSRRKLVNGWYCASSGKQLAPSTLHTVLNSIDLDWNPSKPSCHPPEPDVAPQIQPDISDDDIGSGPLILSWFMEEQYQLYLEKPVPLYFAVSKTGASGYRYCDQPGCGLPTAKRQAIENCEVYSKGIPCKIYAVKKNIVWEGPVTKPAQTDERSLDMPIPGLESRTPIVSKGQGKDGNTYESVAWDDFARFGPNAQLSLNKSTRGFEPAWGADLSSRALWFLNEHSGTSRGTAYKITGERGVIQHVVLGNVRYVTFEAVNFNTKSCFFFSQIRNANKFVLYGWYCAQAKELSSGTIADIVVGIDIDWSKISGKQNPDSGGELVSLDSKTKGDELSTNSKFASKTTESESTKEKNLKEPVQQPQQQSLSEGVSQFDGRWVGEVNSRCAWGNIELNIRKGEIIGSGKLGGAYASPKQERNIFGSVDGQGKMVGVWITGLEQRLAGMLSGENATGVTRGGDANYCAGVWELTRVENPQGATVKADPETSPKQTAQPSDESGDSIETRLRLLNQFLEQGLISEAEAATKRKRILDEM